VPSGAKKSLTLDPPQEIASRNSMMLCKQCCARRFPAADRASRISLHRTAQKAGTSNTISSTAKKVNPALTDAGGSFAVSKANAARFIVPPANQTGFQGEVSDCGEQGDYRTVSII
jgi:hypothetical protein